MEDVTRKRIMRKLEGLPEAQLYQVMDYIEFMEAKYAREKARKPDPFQQFAERVEDQMRVRSLAPRAMRGTMRIMSTAGRMLDGVRELGRDLVEGPRTQSRDTKTTSRAATSPTDPAPTPSADRLSPGPADRPATRSNPTPEAGADGASRNGETPDGGGPAGRPDLSVEPGGGEGPRPG